MAKEDKKEDVAQAVKVEEKPKAEKKAPAKKAPAKKAPPKSA